MATFPPDLQATKRDRPLIIIGVVMGVLLIALLALPFVTRHHVSARHTISSVAPAGVPQAIAR